MPDRPSRLVRQLLRIPTWLYRLHLGALLGHRFLQLTHHGRRTGKVYRTVVEVVGTTSAGEYVVMSGWGRRSDWYRNLMADREAAIDVGRDHFTADHRDLPPTEAVRILAEYERRNRWIAPLLRRVLSRILGWRYDGTAAARTRLVEQLPMVALGPAARPVSPEAPAETRRAKRGCRGAGRWSTLLGLTCLIMAGCAGRSQPAAPGADVGQQLDQALPTAVLQAPLTTSAGQRLDLGIVGRQGGGDLRHDDALPGDVPVRHSQRRGRCPGRRSGRPRRPGGIPVDHGRSRPATPPPRSPPTASFSRTPRPIG